MGENAKKIAGAALTIDYIWSFIVVHLDEKMISKDRFTMKMGTKMADLKRKKRWNCSDGILNKKRNDHKMVTVFM